MGYVQYNFSVPCIVPTTWNRINFSTLGITSCSGERYVSYNTKYGLWVGAVLCNSTYRYKLYMSDSVQNKFLEIADYAGHGQDHCELIKSNFTIPNEDDITSGGCSQCALGGLVDLIDVPVYARSRFGEPFVRRNSTFWADLTTTWYQCGVSIP